MLVSIDSCVWVCVTYTPCLDTACSTECRFRPFCVYTPATISANESATAAAPYTNARENGGKVMMLPSTISALHGGVFTSLFQNRSLETVLSRAHPAHSSFEWLISLSGPLFRHSLFQNRSLETVLSRAYLAHPSCGWLLSLSGPFVSLLPVPDSIARDCTKVSVSSTPLMAFASGGDSALQSISMASPCTRIDRSRLYYGARSSRDQTLSQIQRLKLENPRAPAF